MLVPFVVGRRKGLHSHATEDEIARSRRSVLRTEMFRNQRTVGVREPLHWVQLVSGKNPSSFPQWQKCGAELRNPQAGVGRGSLVGVWVSFGPVMRLGPHLA